MLTLKKSARITSASVRRDALARFMFGDEACPMPVFICNPICSAEMNPFLNPAASPAGLTFFPRDAIMTPISKAYGE